ncbi:hypothetical protein BKA65DRAFT_580543 [Rhexocercosporidium sp. MPI-PUGE-AT-0058]|nr:hypothetical protein BKA65DRAFT_580543 [Rhexocercosporidium sp. MPI-PUGE-AT-0058]
MANHDETASNHPNDIFFMGERENPMTDIMNSEQSLERFLGQRLPQVLNFTAGSDPTPSIPSPTPRRRKLRLPSTRKHKPQPKASDVACRRGVRAIHVKEEMPAPVDVSEALTEFKLFPRLVGELRARIWAFCGAEAALIDSFKELGSSRCNSSLRVPAVLHVCRESRYEFLARKDVVTDHATYTKCRTVSMQGLQPFYIRTKVDSFLLKNMADLHNPQLFLLHHLVIDERSLTGYAMARLEESIYLFRDLRTITIRLRDDQVEASMMGHGANELDIADSAYLEKVKEKIDKVIRTVKLRESQWKAIPKVMIMGEPLEEPEVQLFVIPRKLENVAKADNATK